MCGCVQKLRPNEETIRTGICFFLPLVVDTTGPAQANYSLPGLFYVHVSPNCFESQLFLSVEKYGHSVLFISYPVMLVPVPLVAAVKNGSFLTAKMEK
jgi:hypothetical protein